MRCSGPNSADFNPRALSRWLIKKSSELYAAALGRIESSSLKASMNFTDNRPGNLLLTGMLLRSHEFLVTGVLFA
jgi:hypothetical protein